MAIRVEVPIIVNDMGIQTEIRSEKMEDFVFDLGPVGKSGGTFALRGIEIDECGIEGHLYVLIRNSPEGETIPRTLDLETARKQSPEYLAHTMPKNSFCLHGLAIEVPSELDDFDKSSITMRIDYRGPDFPFTVARKRVSSRATLRAEIARVIQNTCKLVLTRHLTDSKVAQGPDGWIYKQHLSRRFHIPSLWDSLPKMIPMYIGANRDLLALEEARTYETISTVFWCPRYIRHHGKKGTFPNMREMVGATKNPTPTVVEVDMRELSGRHVISLFSGRRPTRMEWLGSSDHLLRIYWTLSGTSQSNLDEEQNELKWLVNIPESDAIGFAFDISGFHSLILNPSHAVTKWLIEVRSIAKSQPSVISQREWDRIMSFVIHSLKREGEGIENLERFAGELTGRLHTVKPMPPITEEMFRVTRKCV